MALRLSFDLNLFGRLYFVTMSFVPLVVAGEKEKSMLW